MDCQVGQSIQNGNRIQPMLRGHDLVPGQVPLSLLQQSVQHLLTLNNPQRMGSLGKDIGTVIVHKASGVGVFSSPTGNHANACLSFHSDCNFGDFCCAAEEEHAA